MRLKNIIIPSIILSSLVGATYDQSSTPNTQTDMSSALGNAISFPANNFGFSSSPFGAYIQPTPSPSPTPSGSYGGSSSTNESSTPTPISTPTITKIEDKNKTTLDLTKNGIIEVDNDGNIKQTLTTDNGVIELEAKSSGEVLIKYNDLNLEVKKGSSVKVNDDNSIEISREVKVDGKSVNTQINIDSNGYITAQINYANGEILNFEFPMDSLNKEVLLEDNTLVLIYKSVTSFFIIENDSSNRRGVTYGKESVKIIPINTEAQFEEKLYLDKNYRGVILRSGEADILIDGKILEMQKDKEYIIIIQNSEKALNSIYDEDTNYLHLREGWSLISSPINSEINVTETFWTNTLAYKFNKNSWIKEPEILKPNEGMWIKYNFNIYVHFK